MPLTNILQRLTRGPANSDDGMGSPIAQTESEGLSNKTQQDLEFLFRKQTWQDVDMAAPGQMRAGESDS